jgi:membrane protease subunit HflK
MPWNDNSNSGPKPGPKPAAKPGGKTKPGPWGAPTGSGDRGGPDNGPATPPPRKPASNGGGGGGGGGSTPDFNQIAGRLSEQVRGYFGGPSGQGAAGKAAIAIVAGVAALWLVSGFYMVQPNERGVTTTFGAYSGQTDPGLRYRLPWPIQDVRKVPFTTLNVIPIGGTDDAPQDDESLMLTSDKNIVDLKFTVQWRVADPYRYVFNLKDPDDAIKAVAESAMREVVGRTELQPILTNGQGQVQTQTAQLMQRILDSYNAGVYVDEVQIRSANSPPKVIAAFRAVAAAKQDADATVNNARGNAAQTIQQALGYKAQVVQEAEGEAARFNEVYEQYKAAPAVTRQRLYIETMEKVLSKANKVIIDNHGATAPIVLSPDTFRPKGSAAATATAPTAITVTPQGQIQTGGAQ